MHQSSSCYHFVIQELLAYCKAETLLKHTFDYADYKYLNLYIYVKDPVTDDQFFVDLLIQSKEPAS